MARFWNVWKAGHKPFEEVGADSFVLATPQGNILFTSDPGVIRQLETQNAESQLGVETLKLFELYGPAVGSTEGDEWKTHRRIIMSGFTPAVNAAVWKEATRQTTALIEHWSMQNSIVPAMARWTSRLALHVLSAVCFDKRLSWKEDDDSVEPLPPGHRMRYEQALPVLLDRLVVIYALPRALLGLLPIRVVREAHTAYQEWTKYMQELRVEAMSRIGELRTKRNKTVLGALTTPRGS